MISGHQSKSSAKGNTLRRGEREGVSNKAQCIKSHPENTPTTSFRGEAVSLESPWRDRIVYPTACWNGHLVEVHLKDGSVYSGIIHAVEKHRGMMLKMASLIEDGTLKGHQSRYEAVKKPPPKTFFIPADNVVKVVAKDLSLSSDGMFNAVQGEKQVELLTDTSISQSCRVEQRRELKPWVPDEDVPQIFEGEQFEAAMIPGHQSKSSAKGNTLRKGEREGVSNKAQCIKSHPANTPTTSFSGEAVSLESPWRDHLVYPTACWIGHLVEVHLKDGSVYSGIIHAVEKYQGMMLKMASLIEDGTLKGHQSRYEAVKKPPPKTFFIPADNVVKVVAKDLSVSSDGVLNAVQGEKQVELLTDTSRRELKPPDEDAPQELVNVFDNPGNRFWDRFELPFGVKSTFNEELYTTKLERGPRTKGLEEQALRIAREIEGESTRDLHVTEERGLQLNAKFEIDEETKYSAVRPVDGFDEEDDNLLDTCNDQTFGGSSTSDGQKPASSTSSSGKGYEELRGDSQPSWNNPNVDQSCSVSDDHAGHLPSEQLSKDFPAPYSSISESQLGERRNNSNQVVSHSNRVTSTPCCSTPLIAVEQFEAAMIPGHQSKSSSDGTTLRIGEKEGVSNKAQSIKSHPANTPSTSFRGEAVSLESPWRDRIVYPTACWIGHLVEVHLKDGSVYSGIIHALEKHRAIILKMASLIEDGTLEGHQSRYKGVKKPFPKTFVIPADNVVKVVAKDLSVSSDGMLNAVQGEKQGELLTDTSISQSCHVYQRRELKPWVPDEDVPQICEVERFEAAMIPGHQSKSSSKGNTLRRGEREGVSDKTQSIKSHPANTPSTASLSQEECVPVPCESIPSDSSSSEYKSCASQISSLSGESKSSDAKNGKDGSDAESNATSSAPVPVHSFGEDSFELFGLPDPSLGEVVGLLGKRKTGKSTVLDLLAGKIKPNLCQCPAPYWEAIMNTFRGSQYSQIRKYLSGIQSKTLKVAMKLQSVEEIKLKKTYHIRKLLALHTKANPYRIMEICEALDLPDTILSYFPIYLDDGELQRVNIACTVLEKADAYLFDEPSNFLTLKQKIKTAKVIRAVLNPDRYVFVADHDEELMEYVADKVYHMEGHPNLFGHVKKDETFSPLGKSRLAL